MVVTGTVKSVDAKGATISLADDVEGYLRASDISRDRVEDARSHMKEGDTVEAMIVNVDRKTRTIKSLHQGQGQRRGSRRHAEMASESSGSSGTTNLGALLKANSTGSLTPEGLPSVLSHDQV